ncbi:hypothetical protein [Synechococcus sp. PCC 7336]|uniref:hypothetical protein n=1 Tax=Synechococcus sp. PCC 7336 TaxID=195250 RepID=UPI000346D0EA|nr:hypothetical protein [Synechococcus sp. PCC 7336]
MQVDNVVVFVVLLTIAVVGLWFAAWPLLRFVAVQAVRGWRQRYKVQQQPRRQRLSSYDRLLDVLNGDRQTLAKLIEHLKQTYPDEPEEWYCQMLLLSLAIPLRGILFAAGSLLRFQMLHLRRRWHQWQKSQSQTVQPLSNYDQLLELLDGDRQSVERLIGQLKQKYPGQPEDWYPEMVLEQLKLWIVNKLSNRYHSNAFGMGQAAAYTMKYRGRPTWWVYRKLAVDFELFDIPPQSREKR